MSYHPSHYPQGGGVIGRIRAALFGLVVGMFLSLGLYLLLTAIAWIGAKLGQKDWSDRIWPLVFSSQHTPWLFLFMGSLGGVVASDTFMWIRMTGRRILPFR